MTSLLLQPLGPFALAIAAGLMAGFVAASSDSVLAFAATVVFAATVLALMDLTANLRAEWHTSPPDSGGRAPLVEVAWELLTANVAVIAMVGGIVYGMLLILPCLR